MGQEQEQVGRPAFQLVVVGHVDHGKSTLIGRLLHDTNSLPDGKLDEIRAISARRGMPIEWSFVLDAFQAERDQAITIDTTQIRFRTEARDYVVIDAPGHREFLKNMVSGAALADGAVLVIDAGEGVRQQTKRHAYLLHLLGLRQVVVAVNKMDVVAFDAARFEEVRREVRDYLAELGIEPLAVVPISARDGDNLARPSSHMAWYGGDPLVTVLDRFVPRAAPTDRPLRLPIQDVYKFDDRRIIAGRLESGHLSVGDTLVFSPSNRSARVASIESWGAGGPPLVARAGQSVGITLDEQIFVERGDIASSDVEMPALSDVIRLRLFWMGHRSLRAGDRFRMKLATRTVPVRVETIDRVIDTDTLASRATDVVERDDVAEVVVRASTVVAVDPHGDHPVTGRCVLLDGYDTVAGGTIGIEGYPDQRRLRPASAAHLYEVDHLLAPQVRALRNGHQGAVFWFTGLSGAGKSTLAMRLEQALFRMGLHVYVLDGDNVRRGLNSDLGFSPEDRVENIRRVGEVAGLFAEAGVVVITAFISPYRSDRARARQATEDGAFHEIYIKADLETCEKRDPKGLYRRARAGEIKDFTGVSAPYEPPEAPDLIVDTAAKDIDRCVDEIVEYVRARVTVTAERVLSA